VSQLEVRAFDAALGAEVGGLDLSRPVPTAEMERLGAALARHLVLRLRGQTIGDRELLRFSRGLGELDPPGPNPYGAPFLPEFPDINVISNVVEDGVPKGNLGYGEAVWHADMTYVEVPPMAAVLYALEVPPAGGDTSFANMYAAYETLPPDLKTAVEGGWAVHDASHNSAGMLRKGYQQVTDVRQTPGARHPLVRTDPASGRKALFLGRRPLSYVVGLSVEDSEVLLDRLWAHATRAEHCWTQRWREGDLLIWHNLSVLHRRDGFEQDARRVMHRTQIRGSERIA